MNRHKIMAQTKNFALASGQVVKRGFAMTRVNFSSYELTAFALFFVVFVLFSLMLLSIDKREFIPASFGAIATAVFAFLAFRFTKEKFRLDLFDRRWAIYNNIVEFCSAVNQGGPKSKEALDAAQGSFRGSGLHQAKALFGPEIIEVLDKLNKTYAWLNANDNAPLNNKDHAIWAVKNQEHDNYVWDTVNGMPELFRMYVYFGDYKR